MVIQMSVREKIWGRGYEMQSDIREEREAWWERVPSQESQPSHSSQVSEERLAGAGERREA